MGKKTSPASNVSQVWPPQQFVLLFFSQMVFVAPTYYYVIVTSGTRRRGQLKNPHPTVSQKGPFYQVAKVRKEMRHLHTYIVHTTTKKN